MAYKADLQQGGTLTTTNKIQFNDSGVFIHSDSDGSLVIQADGAAALKADSLSLQNSANGAPGELRILEDGANGTNYVGFKAAATLGGNIVWQLPNADAGSSGYALVSDGSGVLSWADVSSTLNIDGLTDGTGVTIATDDKIAISDGGAEKYVEMSQLETFMETNLDTLSNVTTVGALAAGSIASGFGAIDNGTSNITTGGILSLDADVSSAPGNAQVAVGQAGSLRLGAGGDAGLAVYDDDLYIENVTSNKDLIFRANVGGTYTTVATLDGANGLFDIVAGKLALGGTAVSATAAELNLIDGGTARGTDAVASGDGLLVNDNGTMKMTNVDTVSTYFAAHSVGGTNMVTVGALDAGSISSGFGAIDNGTSGIRTNTFTAETSVLPDAAGGADLGSATAEWGDIYIADDKGIKFGSDQDVTIEYDEDGTDALLISGGDVVLSDDKKFYFGTGKDASIEYDEDGTDQLRLALPAAGMVLGGVTPTLVIGDAGAEDASLLFDGNALDFHVGLDDSADKLVIGKGGTLGSSTAIAIDTNLKSTFGGDVQTNSALIVGESLKYSSMFKVSTTVGTGENIAASASVILVDCQSGADCLMNLPASSVVGAGHTIIFKRVDGQAARKGIIQASATSETIDGVASLTGEVELTELGQAVTMMCAASGSWIIL